jgi:hypothetical protein
MALFVFEIRTPKNGQFFRSCTLARILSLCNWFT